MTEHAERPVTNDDGSPTGSLDAWVRALAADLGVAGDVVDVQGLLDVARETANVVGRPASPLTTFLVGYAAGSGAGDLADALRRARELADGWADHVSARREDA